MTTDELGTCTYVAEKDDPSNWHGESPDDWMLEEDSWSCPHDALDREDGDAEYCVFHMDPDDVPDDVDEAERFVRAVNEESVSDDEEIARRKKEFVGATFGEFEIKGATLDAGDEFQIHLDHTTFQDGPTVESVTVQQDGLSFKGAAFAGNTDVSLRDTEFVCDIRFDHTEFTGSVRSSRTEFAGDVRFDHAEFTGDVVCLGRFSGNVSFRETEFTGDEIVQFSRFEDDVQFDQAEFSGDANVEFGGVLFSGDASFEHAKFTGGGDVSFAVAEFGDDALLLHTKFTGTGVVSFQDAVFTGDGDVAFADAKFLGDRDVKFNGAEFTGAADVSFRETKFTGGRVVSFRDVAFTGAGEVSFRDAVFNGNVIFLGARYAPDVSVRFVEAKFSGCNLVANSMSNVNFHRADFTDVDLRDVDFTNANLEGAFLSRANLYGADFTGAKLDGAVFGNARIDQNTNFGDEIDYRVPYDFTRTDGSGSGIDRAKDAVRRYLPRQPSWDGSPIVDTGSASDQPEGSNDPVGTEPDSDERAGECASGDGSGDGGAAQSTSNDPTDNRTDELRKAARAYHNLERIGRENSLPDLQTIGFVRRQEMHRLRYAEQAATAESGALKWWGRWLRASVARLTLLYGESPWRVIAVSLAAIVLSGMLYPLGGFRAGDPNNPELIRATSFGEWLSLLPDGIYFSTLTFTTLGFGDFQPAGWGRFLATGETALGATLIALLVFVLGRRASR